MVEKPPVVDAEYQLIDHKLRGKPGDLLAYLLYVAFFAWAAYTSTDPTVHLVAVLAAGAAFPLKRWFGQLSEKVSGQQVDLLRLRMDPRRGWRKRALPGR